MNISSTIQGEVFIRYQDGVVQESQSRALVKHDDIDDCFIFVIITESNLINDSNIIDITIHTKGAKYYSEYNNRMVEGLLTIKLSNLSNIIVTSNVITGIAW